MFVTTIHEGHIYGETCEGLRVYAVDPMWKFATERGAHETMRDKMIAALSLGGVALIKEPVSDCQVAWVEA